MEGDEFSVAVVVNGNPDVVNGEIKQERSASPEKLSNGVKSEPRSESPSPIDVKEGSEHAATSEVVAAPKLSRKASQKPPPRLAPNFGHYPDATDESCQDFERISDCLYGQKHMGYSEHDALDCDCEEEWRDGQNQACNEDSDCINRACKMECNNEPGGCGKECQNQRFQRKQWADVSVIKTEKKGFGLRTNKALRPGDFIFEYIGEVINEPTFRKRMVKYDKDGIKHFYFMSLTKHEFVDATKKGNLGRFCNHSCNPNCYVDKWVVNNKLRMGIFSGEHIQAGEELVFNYNVDRYGADPQPCYCGEENCTGFLGGKTQTERATKLPVATMEALGIEDGDSWDTTVAKKPRKKKTTEDDEEYVNSIRPQSLTEDGVTKVMAALVQSKEKWIAVKLLRRMQNAEDERVLLRVVRMHGYEILKTTLNKFIDDNNVVLQILDVLWKVPRISKNKINDAGIEPTIQSLVSSEHEDIAFESKRLLDEWSKLEVLFRIRKNKDGAKTSQHVNSFDDRRGVAAIRAEESTPVKSATTLPDVVIPTGPKSNIPQRNANFYAPRPRGRATQQGNGSLPAGWFSMVDKDTGRTYYYTKNGTTTWVRPTVPAIDPRGSTSTPALKGPSKAQQEKDAVQDLIDMYSREPVRVQSASQTPRATSTPTQEPKKEKWRSLPIEKQMKLYENTIFAPVKSVTDKYRHKLPKTEIKKFAKEVNKKLVASDYKHNRVDDPTRISSKTEKKVRSYVKDFFDRAVAKYRAQEKQKAEHASQRNAVNGEKAPEATSQDVEMTTGQDDSAVLDEVVLSDVESSPASSGKKRKRDDGAEESPAISPEETPSVKRVKEDGGDTMSPPPPPPPPPADAPNGTGSEHDAVMNEEQAVEAQRREEEAEQHRMQEEALQRENEEAMQEFEKEQNCQKGLKADVEGEIIQDGTREMNAVTNGGDGANGGQTEGDNQS